MIPQRTILFLIIILATVAANAQERPARTWVGGGFTITKPTAEDSGPAIAGAYVEAAYDLRHGLQARGLGEYRSRPAIPKIFTGDEPIRATSEFRYGAALIYHFSREGGVRPFAGSGVQAMRHFFDRTIPRPGYTLYNSSVNPTIVIGAGLGKSSEITFSKYLADTYSYSNLRGFGVDYGYTKRLAGRLHLRAGVRGRFWTFREGIEDYDERSGEVSGFVGIRIQ